MKEQYTEEYFKTMNYSNYLERKDRYFKSAKELDDLLTRICLLNKDDVILDYGCALGFLMAGFREMGYRNVWGYDISQWAVQQSRSIGNNMLDSYAGFRADVLVSLDVFEHMPDDEIAHVLDEIQSKVLIARIPCSTDGGHTFHLEVSRVDPTHINCKDKEEWIEVFKERYAFVTRLNLITIYDSPGVACLLAVK